MRNPPREPDSNSKARDSPQVQMFASHAHTSCTAQPVSPLFLKSFIVLRVWQHRATIAKSARAQSLLAAHDTPITPLYINCDTQSSERSRVLLNPFPKLSPSQFQVVISDRIFDSSLSPVFRIELEPRSRCLRWPTLSCSQTSRLASSRWTPLVSNSSLFRYSTS